MDSLLPTSCDWCPRHCGANRAAGLKGVCGADDKLRVARVSLHEWEEPPISGESGSGTIFFGYCPLRCCYCQNHSIALGDAGADITLGRLVEIMLEQQEAGALNLNMVTPTHYGPLIAEAIRQARAQGMGLPVAWNTSGYETPEALEALQGIVDIYLTDFKYASAAVAAAYSHAPDYPQVALRALDVMVAQVKEFSYDRYCGQKRMTRGVIVRHLLLPGHLEDSMMAIQILQDRYGDAIQLSLMNQYTPVMAADSPEAQKYPNLLEHASNDDYEALLEFADDIGVKDYFWQEGQADVESFIPEFDLRGVLRPGESL